MLFTWAILLVLLVQNSDIFVSLPFTVPTLSDQLSSISPQVWPDLQKAGPDEELHRANSSDCRLWAPYKVHVNNSPTSASHKSCAGEHVGRARPALHPPVPRDRRCLRVRPWLLHRVRPLEHPGGDGVRLDVPPGPPALHPDIPVARPPRPDRQLSEAQLPVVDDGGGVGEDPERARRPAEEDQLPQCGREQQPDGDEERPPRDRAENDREWDSRSAERDLSEPIVPTRGHPRRDIHRVHLLVNVRLDTFSRKKTRKKVKEKVNRCLCY